MQSKKSALDAWPFEAWLRLAVTALGLSPQAFWQTSLIDWFALTRPQNSSALPRKKMDVLMQKFPDQDGIKHDTD